jgi:hypothetical protein
MRRSGKKALIQFQRGALGTPFDMSGVSADGHSRANEFSFKIEGNTVEGDGYNESWVETIPTGQSKWEATLTVFYNAALNEVNAYLWTMWAETHDTADCADPQEYLLNIMPEGDCTGKELWVGTRATLKNLDIQTPHNNVMLIKMTLAGWMMDRSLIV